MNKLKLDNVQFLIRRVSAACPPKTGNNRFSNKIQIDLNFAASVSQWILAKMDQLFLNPEELKAKVEIAEHPEAIGAERREADAREEFSDSARRLLQLLMAVGGSNEERAASLAAIIAPNEGARQKWLLESIIAKDLEALQERAPLLDFLALPEVSVMVEIEVAKDELRGIDAPAGGVKFVFASGENSDTLLCYKGGDFPRSKFSFIPSSRIAVQEIISMQKYRGVLIVCEPRRCSMVTYDQVSGASLLPLAEGTFIRDDTTNPPTLLGFCASLENRFSVARYGEVLESAEDRFECLMKGTSELLLRGEPYVWNGNVIGYAIDESGNIWLKSLGGFSAYHSTMYILSPDLVKLDVLHTLKSASVCTSSKGYACICFGQRPECYRVKYIRQEQAKLVPETEPCRFSSGVEGGAFTFESAVCDRTSGSATSCTFEEPC